MVKFQCDWYNPHDVTSIQVEDDTVKIFLVNREDSFDYSFDDDREAKQKADTFANAILQAKIGKV